MNLALEYRPHAFGDIAGQPIASMVLEMMVRQDDVPEALVFWGTRGSGKTSAARILAAALNCTGIDVVVPPCGQCASCRGVRFGKSVDVIEIDAASNGGAAEMRRICELVTYDVGSLRRVIVLDEAHGVSPAGFDVLLKTLEEPPPRTLFILVTTAPERLPSTIRSRVQHIRFRRIGLRAIFERLVYVRNDKQLNVPDDVLAAIAERADGGMRDAVMLLDQCSRVGCASLQRFYEITGESDFAPGLVEIMASGGLGQLYERVEELVYEVGDPQLITVRVARCLRDVIVLRMNPASPTVVAQGTAREHRRRLAAALTDVQLAGAMTVLWDLLKIRAGTDDRMVLDLATVMMAERFRPARERAAAPMNGNGHRQPQSMEDVQRMFAGT